jgi:hypothetical protein
MGKNPVHMAGSFGAENTGGLLSGFLAEEEVFDRRLLWRLGSWGAVSVGAVMIALYANQSSIGLRRDQIAAADLARQAQQIQSEARESQNETRRLAAAIDTLNGDRDRLYSRVTILEQGLDSVTGAIKRQGVAAAPAQTAPVAAPTTEPQAAAQSPAPAPVVTPVATTAAKAADKPPVDAIAPDQGPATVSSAAPKTSPPPATPATAVAASKSTTVPPEAAAEKPIEPEKPAKPVAAASMPEVASVQPADEAEPDAEQATTPKVAVQRTEFGVDVGSANSMGGLRALWRGLLKSNSQLAALRPIIVVKESSSGLGMQLRLVAGPLVDAAAAARICAALVENNRSCETAVFDGQRLAMKTDEPAATAKPAEAKPAEPRTSGNKRGASKRTSEDAPVRRSDPPSTLSSFFGRR